MRRRHLSLEVNKVFLCSLETKLNIFSPTAFCRLNLGERFLDAGTNPNKPDGAVNCRSKEENYHKPKNDKIWYVCAKRKIFNNCVNETALWKSDRLFGEKLGLNIALIDFRVYPYQRYTILTWIVKNDYDWEEISNLSDNSYLFFS